MNILITGTSRGIGKAIALRFLAEGHVVTGFDLLPAAIEDPSYRHLLCDVRRPEAFPNDLKPHILINNAGVQESGHDIETNLTGVINVTEKYIRQNENLRAVVMIGSASAHTGAEFPAYAASKGGLLAYTKNVANRIAPQATCNSIDPGGVLTETNLCVIEDPRLWDQVMALTPMKRWAEPEEIADWVYFVSVTNRFMTGQNLLIDGGEAGQSCFVWPENNEA